MEYRQVPARLIWLWILFGALAVFLLSRGAWAEDARVLPKGRSRLSYGLGVTAPISRTFNSDGTAESLTRPYNLELTSQNLKTFDQGLSRLVGLLNSTGARFDAAQTGNGFHGLTTDPDKPLIGDALSRGSLDVNAEAQRTQGMVSYQYGITDRLSVGFMIPLIRTQVRVAGGIRGTNTASEIYKILESSFPEQYGEFKQVPGALAFVSGADTETLQTLLESKGYERFQSTDRQGLGDVVFGGRYNYWNQKTAAGEWISSAQLGVSAPTGRLRRPAEITETDFGQGAWELSGAQILNYSPVKAFTFSHGLHYSRRLASQRLMRVRENAGDFIPDASTEESVNVQLGDKLWTSFGARLQLTSAFSIDSSLEMFWKNEDRFAGAYPTKDYAYLSENTASYTETFQIGASLNSIGSFLAGGFPLPGELSVNYFHPTRGKNAVIAPYATAELALYF